jgi:hypothetical protein
LINGDVARAAASVCSHDTYFDMNLSWFSQRTSTVAMPLKDDRYLQTKRSGYNLGALIRHARRLLLSSHLKVIDAFTVVGIVVVGLSVAATCWVLFVKLFAPERILVAGWTSVILAICFFGGLLTAMLGVALQYLSTLVLKAHGKPTFFTIRRRFDRTVIANLLTAVENEGPSETANAQPTEVKSAAASAAE